MGESPGWRRDEGELLKQLYLFLHVPNIPTSGCKQVGMIWYKTWWVGSLCRGSCFVRLMTVILHYMNVYIYIVLASCETSTIKSVVPPVSHSYIYFTEAYRNDPINYYPPPLSFFTSCIPIGRQFFLPFWIGHFWSSSLLKSYFLCCSGLRPNSYEHRPSGIAFNDLVL